MFKTNESGFSIIEMIVTVAIGGLLMILVFNSYIHIVQVAGRSSNNGDVIARLQMFQYRIGKEIREGRRSNTTVPACLVGDTAGMLPDEGGDSITITTYALSDQYDNEPLDGLLELVQVRYRFNEANGTIERLVNTCDELNSEIDDFNFNADGNWSIVFENVVREGPNLGGFREVSDVFNVNTEQLFEVRFRVVDPVNVNRNIMSPNFRYSVRGLE